MQRTSWRCKQCTFLNAGNLALCAMCDDEGQDNAGSLTGSVNLDTAPCGCLFLFGQHWPFSIDYNKTAWENPQMLLFSSMLVDQGKYYHNTTTR
eukprot:scaffold18147_cov82-Attheya_sp.AAC.2